MNIFVLDHSLQKCAQYHLDKHVIKMILEGCQILCTVCSQFGLATPYRPTHIKHPCVLWAARSLDNWLWLRRLVTELNAEYRYRYNRLNDHKSFVVADSLQSPPLPQIGLTEHCQAMPSHLWIPGDPVTAYRNYYMESKHHLAVWTKRGRPKWYRPARPIS